MNGSTDHYIISGKLLAIQLYSRFLSIPPTCCIYKYCVYKFTADKHLSPLSQGLSEYVRTYRSPDELRRLSPDPPHHVSAGLSSAEMAVTHEPALPRKRKDPSHDRKVTFTTDYTEHGSPTKEVQKLNFGKGHFLPLHCKQQLTIGFSGFNYEKTQNATFFPGRDWQANSYLSLS